MLRNIIWDLDGTIFDTYPAISRAFRAALNAAGADASLEEINALARTSLGFSADSLCRRFGLDQFSFEQSFDEHYGQTGLEDQPLFPGIEPVLKRIGARDGLNLIFTHRGRASTLGLLAALGVADFFAGVLSTGDGYPKKPDPAGFLALLAAHELKPNETLTVGDRQIDVQAGKAAGLFTVLFKPEADSFGADLCIADYSELFLLLTSSELRPA
jgi:phosphoglycolate phosphatase-like HAD superfamily hydrolase